MNLSETKGKERALEDGLFLERLETVLDKNLADLRAFAEREARPFEEIRKYTAEWHCKYLFDPHIASDGDIQERIHNILRSTSQTLESLYEIGGLQSFFLVVNPNDPSDEGFLGGTVMGREFWRCHRGCGAAGAKAFQAECIKAAQGKTSNSPRGDVGTPLVIVPQQRKGPASALKAEVYAGVRNAIREVSGIRNAEMKWKDHSRLDVYGIQLVGWPTGVPMQNPSSLSVAQNKQVLQALHDRSLSFFRIAGASPANLVPGALLDESEDDFSWAYKDPDEVTPAEAIHSTISAGSQYSIGSATQAPNNMLLDSSNISSPSHTAALSNDYSADSEPSKKKRRVNA